MHCAIKTKFKDQPLRLLSGIRHVPAEHLSIKNSCLEEPMITAPTSARPVLTAGGKMESSENLLDQMHREIDSEDNREKYRNTQKREINKSKSKKKKRDCNWGEERDMDKR